MNNKIIIGAVATCIMGLHSCKTSEKNYRTAYEVAKTATAPASDPEIDRLISEEDKGLKVAVGNDSVRMKTEFISLIDGTGDQQPDAYGVVVGDFKQVFNARSFRKRLISKGYPSYVVKNREEEYYVVVKGFATAKEAAEFIKNKNKTIPFPVPIEPFVINSAR